MIRSVLTTLCTLLAGLTLACTPTDSGPSVEFRAPVFVHDVEIGTVEDRVVVTGTLRAPEVVQLRAETAGILEIARGSDGRRLREGDSVAAGQQIAEITGEDVKLAAGTEATQERYETVRRDFESKKQLHEDGLLSDQEFRAAVSSLAEAKIEWERSVLTETRSQLITPLGGVILRLARDDGGMPLASGQLIRQGYEVAQIAPVATLIGDVDLVGADLSRIREGLQAVVRHHAWDDQTFDGVITRLAPALDPMTRTLRAEVLIRNPGGRLRPGMFIEASIIAERREEVLVVPRESVTERDGRRVVFVIEGQKVSQREVVVGLGDDRIVEIRQGVGPDDPAVVRGLETLTDEAKVRVTGS
jgi:RND family efflux transporter MFP subunit